MSVHLPVEYVVGLAVPGFADHLGAQGDKEVDPAEVAVGQAGQPGPDFRLDLDLIQPCHASAAIAKAARYHVPEAL